MTTTQQAQQIEAVVYYNNSTGASTSNWYLTIPANKNRQGWFIKNLASGHGIEVGFDDGFGNVNPFTQLSANEQIEQVNNVISNSIFIRPLTGSTTDFLASEYISK